MINPYVSQNHQFQFAHALLISKYHSVSLNYFYMFSAGAYARMNKLCFRIYWRVNSKFCPIKTIMIDNIWIILRFWLFIYSFIYIFVLNCKKLEHEKFKEMKNRNIRKQFYSKCVFWCIYNTNHRIAVTH
jgi:hypothetical protein